MNSFCQTVFNDLNDIRKNPSVYIKRFEVVRTGLSRFKTSSTSEMLKDIEAFNKYLAELGSITELTFSPGLSKAAENQLEIFEHNKKVYQEFAQHELEQRAKEHVSGFITVFQITDEGAEGPSDVINKVILNRKDKDKKNRKFILDPEVRFVGIAHRVLDKENVTVIIFADKIFEKKARKPLRKRSPDEDLEEIKKAFDWFDVEKTGLINIEQTIQAMRQLGYDLQNPEMFEILLELTKVEDAEDGIDFDDFADTINDRLDDTNSEVSLRRIFNLFIDDKHQDTITLQTLKKICRETGKVIPAEELKDMMDKASVNATDITFEEFRDIMWAKYPPQ
jgi:Ca2+-binding EF-hand superfamily protein